MSLSQDYDYMFKILLIGNSNCGKSSLLIRLSDNVFNEPFHPTIGVDFKIRTMNLDNKLVKLQIWDTAGQEKFKTITSSYYKGAHGIMMVYNIDDRESFSDMNSWLEEIEKYGNENVTKILIGNKCDLDSGRQVGYDEAKAFADDVGIEFLETSAKDAINIEHALLAMANGIKAKVEARTENNKVNLRPPAREKKGGCC